MVINIVCLLLEFVKLSLLLFGILNLEYKRKTYAAWGLIGVCIVCLIIKGIQDSDYRISSFTFLVVFICAMMLNGKRKLLLSITAYLLLCFWDDMVGRLIDAAGVITYESMKERGTYYLIVVSVSAVVLLAITLLLYFFCPKRKQIGLFVQKIGAGYLVLCILGFFAVTMLTTAMGSINVKISSALLGMLIGCILILGCAFFVIWLLLLQNHNSKNVYKQKAEMNQKLLASQEQYYQMLLEKESETRRFRHDITNHMLCLDVLLKEQEYDDARKYLANLTGELQELGPKVQTGNRLVNAILNDISQKYTDVSFDWNGLLPQKMQLPNMDICTIFSNILENAFVAAAGCEEDGKVAVEVQEVGNGLKIVVQNNKSEEVEVKDGKFVTRKEDKKNHGFGTMNVKECVKRNGGTVEYDYTVDSFTVKLLLVNAF